MDNYRSQYGKRPTLLAGLAVMASLALLFALAGCGTPPTPEGSDAMPPLPGTPATTSASQPSPTPTDTPAPQAPLVVPAPQSQTPWVQARLEAVSVLYNLSSEGRALLASLDVRQMIGQPGFFGSYGYHGWTGLGEAKPIQVMHELSHSYWGAFPITGRPDLSWDVPKGRDISPAMSRYHSDVLAFMSQPADAYEPLRERLRLLPALSATNTEPLFHTVEADLIYTVGGDLSLLPPILRKYWDRFLQPGPWGSWETALGWYKSLSPSDRAAANGYVGFEHFDLRGKRLPPVRGAAVAPELKALLAVEERQRLTDAANYFDAMMGDPEKKEDFNFWRGYLRDLQHLRAKHFEHLRSLSAPRAADIDSALAFLDSLRGLAPVDRARALSARMRAEPFVTHFLPAVDDATLLALFLMKEPPPMGATLKGTAAFVELLKKLTPLAEGALREGRTEASAGAARLSATLTTLGLEDKQQVDQLLGIMADTDNETTRRIIAALDDSVLRKLLPVVPARLRGLMDAPRFAAALDITTDAPAQALAAGVRAMVVHTSGNHLIDEPFLDHTYGVLSARAARETLSVLRQSALPMARFLHARPADVVRIMSSDVPEAAALVAGSGLTYPPVRFLHDLVYADPSLAAEIVRVWWKEGLHRLLIPETLAQMAYDADRLAKDPGLHVSLERDGAFLAALLRDQGEDWLFSQLGQAIATYRAKAEQGEVPSDFLDAFRRSLDGSVGTVSDQEAARALARVVAAAFH